MTQLRTLTDNRREVVSATHRANMVEALRALSEAAGEPDLSTEVPLGW